MLDYNEILKNEATLDPGNWDDYRKLTHEMVDDIFTFLQTVRNQPVWEKPPQSVKDFLKTSLPSAPEKVERIYADFRQNILPYRKGNIHPMFFSWVEGNGTITGVMADSLMADMRYA